MAKDEEPRYADAWDLPYSHFLRESDGRPVVTLPMLDSFAGVEIDLEIAGRDLFFWVANQPYARLRDIPDGLRDHLETKETLFVFYRGQEPAGEMLVQPLGQASQG